MTAAIILAAGASTRLGQPKQLISLAGETLLDRSIRTAADAGLAPIFVVLPTGRPDLRPSFRPSVHLIENPADSEGMASSIRAGIAAAQGGGATAAIILACDQPAVTSDHLRRLASTPDRITASRYAGRIGVPAFFPSAAFPELAQLRGDKGARDLLLHAATVDLLDGDLDIDTAAELARARARFAPDAHHGPKSDPPQP